MINISVDRLRWLVREHKHLTLDGASEIAKAAPDMLAEIERLRVALEFYRDPFTWKKKHDPGDDVQVPDFYSETSFGDTAEVALAVQQKGDGK